MAKARVSKQVNPLTGIEEYYISHEEDQGDIILEETLKVSKEELEEMNKIADIDEPEEICEDENDSIENEITEESPRGPLHKFLTKGGFNPDCTTLDDLVNNEFTEQQHDITEVQNPSHYDYKIKPWDAIKAWGLDFDLGSAVKYISRAGHKNGESKKKDLCKAIDFLYHEIDNL